MPWQAKSAKSAQMQMKIYSTFATCQYAHTHTQRLVNMQNVGMCKLRFGQQFQYFMRPTWRMSNVSCRQTPENAVRVLAASRIDE